MNAPPQVTLKHVAAALGVSSTTVSLALRDHPRIPASRRLSIQDAARRMGYQPNPMASALSHQRWEASDRPVTAELAWLNFWKNPEQLRSFKEFDLLWHGAERAARRHGFRLVEFIAGESLSRQRLDGILQSRNIQGILVPPHGGQAMTPSVANLSWQRYAVTKFGYSIPDLPAHIVSGNHVHNALIALEAILARGYRRVAYVCHAHSSTRGKAGFLMHQLKLPPEQRLPVLELDVQAPDVLRQLDAWLRANQPDALQTEVAELPCLLAGLGIQVPRDLALAATSVLDGNVDAGVYQNSEDIGGLAAETVIGFIFNHQTGFRDRRAESLVEGRWQDGSMLPDRRLSDKPAEPLRGV